MAAQFQEHVLQAPCFPSWIRDPILGPSQKNMDPLHLSGVPCIGDMIQARTHVVGDGLQAVFDDGVSIRQPVLCPGDNFKFRGKKRADIYRLF